MAALDSFSKPFLFCAVDIFILIILKTKQKQTKRLIISVSSWRETRAVISPFYLHRHHRRFHRRDGCSYVRPCSCGNRPVLRHDVTTRCYSRLQPFTCIQRLKGLKINFLSHYHLIFKPHTLSARCFLFFFSL